MSVSLEVCRRACRRSTIGAKACVAPRMGAADACDRRVYLGPVFVLSCVMIHGITEKRAAVLRELVGVSIRTLRRWRAWWRKAFPSSGFWHAMRSRFAPPVEEALLPGSLVGRFGQPEESERLLAVLRFLVPLSAGVNCSMDR